MRRAAPEPAATAGVGRAGRLRLRFGRAGGVTELAACYFELPLQALPAIALDDGAALLHLLNPTGGVVAGDQLALEIALAAGAHAVITTPSATRVYRSTGATARQDVRLTLAAGAVLEWFPDSLIPYAGARFEQTLEARLADGALLLLWDAFSAGRVARGERFAFARFANTLRVVLPDGRGALERYVLEPAREDLTAPGRAEGWDQFASLYVVTNRPVDWSDLAARCREAVGGLNLAAGASTLAAHGLAVRLAAASAIDLAVAQERLWDGLRRALLGRALPPLRKY